MGFLSDVEKYTGLQTQYNKILMNKIFFEQKRLAGLEHAAVSHWQITLTRRNKLMLCASR